MRLEHERVKCFSHASIYMKEVLHVTCEGGVGAPGDANTVCYFCLPVPRIDFGAATKRLRGVRTSAMSSAQCDT
jgi:hypothetical protein